MAIPSQQIGWSQRAKLLWQISKQLENLIKVAGNVQLTTTTTSTVAPTTTTTTTVAPLNLSISDSNCGSVITVVPVTFITGTSFCSLDPLPTFSGDFVEFPPEVYGIYNGQSRTLVKVSDTVLEAVGGAPNECVTCG
jgi:hypothetical protein